MSDDPAAALRLKQMDHLQSTIQRLAGNSFLIKGWAITLATALLGVALKDYSGAMARVGYLSVLPTLCFWLLDAYYLAAERAMRRRYGGLAKGGTEVTVSLGVSIGAVVCAAFHGVTLLPYLPLAICGIWVGCGGFAKAAALLSA